MSNTMTIGANTNLQNLQTFLEGAGSKTKVYGSRDTEKGPITLYLKPKAETLMDKIKDKFQSFADSITGRAATRRDAAREGIKSLFTKLDGQFTAGTTISNLICQVRDDHMDGFDMNLSKAHRVGQLSDLVGKMQKMADDVTIKPKVAAKTGEQALSEIGLGMDKAKPQLEGGPEVYIKGPPEHTAKPIEIGGKRYEPVKHLASGGFGHVFEYKEPKSGQRIAFKVTTSNANNLLQAAAKEIAVHQKLCETKNDKVIDFIGAIRMPDGSVGIASELAPLGDVQQAAKKINERIAPDENNMQPGQITRAEAKVLFLTLLKDMAKGLQHIHESGDMTHLDFKSGNVLIDSTGKAKISDFGTTFSGPKLSHERGKEIQCAAYKAPELCYMGGSKLKQMEKVEEGFFESQAQKETQHLANQLDVIFPNSGKELSMKLAENVFHERKEVLVANSDHLTYKMTAEISNPQKVDVWGLGASAVEMFTGKAMLVGDFKFGFQGENRLDEFYQDPGHNALAPRTGEGKLSGKSVAESTGDVSIDTFLNNIMKANPEDRPTAGEIAGNEIFNQPGIGSNSARLLLSFIIENDGNIIIESSRQSLRNDMGIVD